MGSAGFNAQDRLPILSPDCGKSGAGSDDSAWRRGSAAIGPDRATFSCRPAALNQALLRSVLCPGHAVAILTDIAGKCGKAPVTSRLSAHGGQLFAYGSMHWGRLEVDVGGRMRGVFVGVNECPIDNRIRDLEWAENDATDVCSILTEPDIGTLRKEDATLLLGHAANAADIKEILRSIAFESGPDDVLFVYFAGHGLLSPWSPGDEPYLVTSDFSIEGLKRDPDRGLRMGFLRRDVFGVAPCSSFLVLDCCHAGGFADAERTVASDRSLRHAFDEFYARQLSRHSALLACPTNATTRERADLRHGVFTFHLLAGLEGAAAGADGTVTFEGLAGYVAALDLDPKPGLFVHGFGRTTVLTRPRPKGPATQSVHLVLEPLTPPSEIVTLANPLDDAVDPLLRLVQVAFRGNQWPPLRGRHADSASAQVALVQSALDATAAAVVNFGSDTFDIAAVSGRFERDGLPGVLTQLSRRVGEDGGANLGYICSEQSRYRTLAVPVAFERDNRVVCVVALDPARALLAMGEPLATVVRALWRADQRHDGLLAELGVLTALRGYFGRLPLAVFNYAFNIYRQLLSSIIMVFEPVMSLSTNPAMVGVHSWEALARRQADDRAAPRDLLEAAHVWGDQFVVERDRVIARQAILAYAQAHSRGTGRHGVPDPVSINVAVRSLLRDEYADAVEAAIEEAGLGPHKVTLEISERDAIAPSKDEVWLPNPIRYFQERLGVLGRRLRVNFAVDDFGVGHASLDRLAKLTLAQIKVDREILHHPLALAELSLVVNMAEQVLPGANDGSVRPVIVEGFDDESPVRLRDIYRCGIRYVQGYITERPASPELHSLRQDVRERVAAEVRSSIGSG